VFYQSSCHFYCLGKEQNRNTRLGKAIARFCLNVGLEIAVTESCGAISPVEQSSSAGNSDYAFNQQQQHRLKTDN
jgi:hypothetical protein